MQYACTGEELGNRLMFNFNPVVQLINQDKWRGHCHNLREPSDINSLLTLNTIDYRTA